MDFCWNTICCLTDETVLGTGGHSIQPPQKKVRAILVRKDGKIAVMYEEKTGLYALPGGGIEDVEDETTALHREIFEETGCSCDTVIPLGIVSENRYHADVTRLSYFFIVHTKSEISTPHFTEEEIAQAIKNTGKMIDDSYDGRPILLVSILKGAFVFMADLLRAVTVPCEIGFMCAKSYYQGTVSSGVVKITMDLDQDISNYHVIIVEDIIDTGRTLKDVYELLLTRNPLSLKVITLLDKPSRRLVDFKADLALFTIPDHFVIGYGLDCGEFYRNLPYIAEYSEG